MRLSTGQSALARSRPAGCSVPLHEDGRARGTGLAVRPPGGDPLSSAWQLFARTDTELVAQWWLTMHGANVVLIAEGYLTSATFQPPSGMTAPSWGKQCGLRAGNRALLCPHPRRGGRRERVVVLPSELRAGREAVPARDRWSRGIWPPWWSRKRGD